MNRMELENAEVSGDEPESDLDDDNVDVVEEGATNGVDEKQLREIVMQFAQWHIQINPARRL